MSDYSTDALRGLARPDWDCHMTTTRTVTHTCPDCAAKDQRIAELESQLRRWEGSATAVCHTEYIICPACGRIQCAIVSHGVPFNDYSHECECGYTITESEWERCRPIDYNAQSARIAELEAQCHRQVLYIRGVEAAIHDDMQDGKAGPHCAEHWDSTIEGRHYPYNPDTVLDVPDYAKRIAELQRVFVCQTCGAQFPKGDIPDAVYDGVTQCTKCVENKLLNARIAELDEMEVQE